MNAPQTLRFQPGGAVGLGSFYAERQADKTLLESLQRGDHCYVLAPRQVGKTSLCARVLHHLEEQGHRGVIVDLQTIGITPTADEWYASVADTIALQLGLDVEVPAFWAAHASISRSMRLQRFLRDVVLAPDPRPVCVIIDEVEHLLALPEVRADFLAAVRGMFNARAHDDLWARLSFCLVGVATVRDLDGGDPRLTPFNIAHEIRLDDLSREEGATLADGVANLGAEPADLLDAIWSWTHGHPALTQQLCGALVAEGAREAAANARVDALVERMFLRPSRVEHPILLDTQRRFERAESEALVPQMLEVYESVLRGEDVRSEGNEDVLMALRVAGLVTLSGDPPKVCVRNRIYASLFGEPWVRDHQMTRLIARYAREWKNAHEDRSKLLTGAELRRVAEWARGREDLTRLEDRFLHTSWHSGTRLWTAIVLSVSVLILLAPLVLLIFVRLRGTIAVPLLLLCWLPVIPWVFVTDRMQLRARGPAPERGIPDNVW